MSTAPDEAARDDSLAAPPSASPADLLFPDLDEELSATRRMLAQVPDGHADWRPHDRSMTLGVLATHLAELPGFPGLMLAHDEFDMSGSDFEQNLVDDTDGRLEIFDEAAATMRDLLDDLTWDRAMAEWTLRVDGEVLMQGPRSVLVRSAGLSHMAHHRAQLGVYLRLLDVPLPGSTDPRPTSRGGRARTGGDRPAGAVTVRQDWRTTRRPWVHDTLPENEASRYISFSAAGFTNDFERRAAGDRRITLVDLERLFG